MAGNPRVEAGNILNGQYGIAAYVNPTGPMKLALASTTGTDTTAGTEVTGGSYARQTIVMAAPTLGSPTTTSNTSLISFTGMPAATTTGIDIYDSAGTPVRRGFAPLTTPKTTAAADTLSFAAGAVAASQG